MYEEQPAPPGVDEELVLLGQFVRRLRRARTWPQTGLAARAEVPQSTISRLERCLRPGLRADALARILFTLGVFEQTEVIALKVAERHHLDWLSSSGETVPPWQRFPRCAYRPARGSRFI